ncbi:unnamed protein product [Thelazia callipaeda]|uniref:Cytochrome c oxidase subunit n=1 Tax=Thelazia callipaeda TaxID=103827 RepID=A0A0N5D068_THECL|nr:unnamed protein product [Thelazia callipaeda]
MSKEAGTGENNTNLHKKSTDFGELPLTLKERLKQLDINDYVNRSPDDPRWFDRKYNEKHGAFSNKNLLWASPIDARYQQIKMGRHCFDYYIDFHRCITLLGEDHKPCKFFYNVYTDICPSAWVEKFDEWREAGIYPARFDR